MKGCHPMKILAAGAALLVLTACAHQPLAITEGQALASGWSTLKFVSQIADAEAKAGALHGSAAANVAQDLTKANQALSAAQALYNANHSADIATQIAEAAALSAAVLNIIHPAS
jgi:hypothetical protein